MRSTRLWSALLVLLFAFTSLLLFDGCAGRRRAEDVPMDVAWAKIKDYYERERYLDASERLEIFLINHAGSTLADSAQYLLAQSHFWMKEYIIAASEYNKLITQYPRSPLVEEGEYDLGLSYYQLSPKFDKDQEYTRKAIDTFQLFIEDFPNSEFTSAAEAKIEELRTKLAKKDFRAGRLYHKMHEYEAARVYYQSVLDNFYDTEFAVEAQLRKADSYADQKLWSESVAAYRAFLTRYPDTRYSSYVQQELEHARLLYARALERAESGDESPLDDERLLDRE